MPQRLSEIQGGPPRRPTGTGSLRERQANADPLSVIRAKPGGASYRDLRGGEDSIGFATMDLLRRTGEPASAVAHILSGDPKGAVESIKDIVRQREKQRTIGLSDVPFIKAGTDRLPWYVRAPVNFGLDVAGDPLTYVTFGTAGVLRGASGRAVARIGGRETAELAARRAALKGARRGAPEGIPLLQDVARGAAITSAERAGLDRAIQVGLRLPFTRERSITLAGVNVDRAAAAIRRFRGGPAARLDDSIRSSFQPTRGASPGGNYMYQSVRRAAEVEARAWQKEAQGLGRRIYQRANQNKVKPADLNRMIARHLDNPDKYDAPVFAQDLVDEAKEIFERIGQRELADGVRRATRENYVPHLILRDRKGVEERLASIYGSKLKGVEDPFFTRERLADTFDDLEFAAPGVKYETNIERLIEARAVASTRSRIKHAVDRATYEAHGVGRPLVDDAKAVGKLDAARDEFLEATGRYRAAQSAGVKGPELDRLKAARKSAEKKLMRAGGKVDEIAAANARLLDMPVSRLSSSTEEWKTLLQGWDQVADAGRYSDALLPPDVAKDLRAMHKTIADAMTDPVAPLRFMRQVGGSWKRLALATPGFHIRNQLDDALRAWWAGARNPHSYGQAARVLRGGNTTIKTRAGTYTADDMFDLARTHGVVDVGFVAQEAATSEATHRFHSQFFRYGAGRRANPLKLSEDVGAFREDWNRLALFIERLKAGDNPVEAAMQVRKYLFDYGEVGQFVNTARRYWMPFITYAWKVVPTTVGEFARRPGRLSHIYAAQRTAWEEAGQPDMRELDPADRLAMPVPTPVAAFASRALGLAPDAEGNPQTVLINPKRVFGYDFVLSELGGIRSRRDASQVATGMLNPLVKAPIEMGLGYSMYFERPFPKRQKANAVEQLVLMATRGVGGGEKKDAYTGETVPGINPHLSYLLRMLPQTNQASAVATLIPGARGTNTSGNLPATRTLFGLPVTTMDRARRKWIIERYGE